LGIGDTPVLAGHTAADDVHRVQNGRVERADVAVEISFRKMCTQHGLAERIVLHLSERGDAGLLEAEIEAADSGE
jgi:hypothetical protein